MSMISSKGDTVEITKVSTKVMPPIFFPFKCGTGEQHCPAPPASTVLQSATCVQHSSSTKWHVFNTAAVQNSRCCGHTKQRVVNDLLTPESASLMEIHKHIRHIYVEDATDVSSDTASIV